MRIGNLFKGLAVLLAATTFSFADSVTPEALSAGGAVTRDRQLTEISQILRGGRGGYIDAGFYYLPSAEQMPLESKYGEHDGFAFRQHMAGFFSGDVSPERYFGLVLWFDRSGWDGEDFVLFPHYTDYSLVRSTTTWGMVYTDVKSNATIAAGMQHSNVEHVGNIYADESDSLAYSWGYFRWGNFSASGSFYRTSWRNAHVNLDLESRSVYGGRLSGPLTYLPNFDIGFYNGHGEDSIRVTWEQNLFAQRLYGKVSFDFPDGEFHSASLAYYPDPSRMIGFEATCVRRGVRSGFKDLLWGGAVDLLFVRLAYNSSYDYDNFFGAKGTFIAEVKFGLAALDGFLFGRGAARTAPLETEILKEKNKSKSSEESGFSLNPGSSKTIEAKGIRYEKGGK
ncbi:hypothetical protein SAMN05720766_10562 [Fibrobacter sp. UWH9]|uniref:hypothetical protein n=1 Tax=unclassified Fibrobacter TaxID=2634177 RepID=UPI00092229DF|nr:MULTISPECIES: hypothetical protein [Fibrobacter]MCQ2100565.1 hypothetical protein [Fibrobacter sp.]MCL4100733.1 hypothetical protein [Fibrobacter succinogenes]MDO4946899.1 hypothetical protein [Fibrobacter sp.]OWV05674.1 hypothetical protein B7992_15400 [Fibrobacter sp. UWH1]OWV08265.1 hypothetical protein B7993_01135 [Fibrobacter sp. UWH3]